MARLEDPLLVKLEGKNEKNEQFILIYHSRMRGQSSGLVMAADKNLAIGVLFNIHHDVIVRKGCFQRGSTLKFLKNF